jgi:hypothetical protein
MRIIILSDSLGYPRDLFIKNNYTALLKKSLRQRKILVTVVAIPGATMLKIFNELKKKIHSYKKIKRTKNYLFDAIIIQCGIVDCTPRPFNRVVAYMFLRLPFVNKLYNKLSRSSFFLSRFGRPWVSEKKFYNTILKIQSLASTVAKKIIFLEIAKPSHHLIINCGDFSKTVDKYNNILKSFKNRSIFVKLFNNKLAQTYLLQDGHHLNLQGHKLYYSKIKSTLKILGL